MRSCHKPPSAGDYSGITHAKNKGCRHVLSNRFSQFVVVDLDFRWFQETANLGSSLTVGLQVIPDFLLLFDSV